MSVMFLKGVQNININKIKRAPSRSIRLLLKSLTLEPKSGDKDIFNMILYFRIDSKKMYMDSIWTKLYYNLIVTSPIRYLEKGKVRFTIAFILANLSNDVGQRPVSSGNIFL